MSWTSVKITFVSVQKLKGWVCIDVSSNDKKFAVEMTISSKINKKKREKANITLRYGLTANSFG